MEDYDITNAREWDVDYKEPPKQQAAQSEWQVVTNSKRREPFQHRTVPPPQQLARQPPQSFGQHQRSASQQQRPANNPQQQPDPQRQQQRQQNNGPPRPWQTSGAPLKPEQGKRPPPKLSLNSDNDAEAAWRARAQPIDRVRIPEDLVLQDRYHEQIAKQYGTFVFSPHPRGTEGSKTFGIWGEAKAVALTKEAIATWVEEAVGRKKSDRSAKFAHIKSLTPKLRERAERRWDREVMRQRFRQHPPPDMAFQAIGSFHWPTSEYKPEEILGASHEALDPVRVDCACYVVFYKDRNVFRVMGKAADVQAGLQRLRRTCFQIAARQVSPVRKYLIRWTIGASMPIYMYLKDYDWPAALSPESATLEKPGHSPICGGTDPDDDRSRFFGVQTGLSTERLRTLMFTTLRKLHYYRGSIQMRIRIGTFLVSQYRAPKDGYYELEEYEKMIQQSQFEGLVTQEVGDKATEDALLPALQAATDLINPSDAMIADLSDVKPVYSATFTFADEAGNLRLLVEWQESQDADGPSSHFEQLSKKWTRLDRDIGMPTSLLDISLTNPNAGTAWQFDLLASQAVDEARLPQQLVNFARNLRIDPVAARKQSPDLAFVRCNPYAGLRSFQQRISYRYNMANSDFKLELSRVEDRLYPARSSDTASGLPKVIEPRWSLSVYRTEWDSTLSENERLAIGDSAGWEDDVLTWFPADVGPGCSSKADEKGKGWDQLMEKLERVESLVRSVQLQDE